MNEKHYNEKLPAFLDHELSADERQKVGEHILALSGMPAGTR